MLSYFDIRKVCPHNTVHYTPHVCNGVLVLYRNVQLRSDETPRTLATEEIFGPHCFFLLGVYVLQIHLNRIYGIRSVILEAGNSPWSLQFGPILGHLADKHPLDQALV